MQKLDNTGALRYTKPRTSFLHNAAIWVLRNGTCEPGQGRNTAAISRTSHVPRGCLDGSIMRKRILKNVLRADGA